MLLLATRSIGKLRELRALFARRGIEVTDLDEVGIIETPDEEGIEVGATFEENAIAKAEYFFALTGRPTVADDSGLEVVALGGRPGVRSRRWSGRTDLTGTALDEANNSALLASLRDASTRAAQYVCVAAYVDATQRAVVRGETAGTILEEPRGAGGFGYDPYFLSVDLGVTFGEASVAQKEQVSHRGRAFQALIARLAARG